VTSTAIEATLRPVAASAPASPAGGWRPAGGSGDAIEERDYVDDFLESDYVEGIPNLDLTVEGIVHRISGIRKRL
jgi:hypothetical protein